MPTLTLYAVCWRDGTEPWGWEPIHDEFYWTREAADEALAYTLDAMEIKDVGSEYDVQAYEIPPPPGWDPILATCQERSKVADETLG